MKVVERDQVAVARQTVILRIPVVEFVPDEFVAPAVVHHPVVGATLLLGGCDCENDGYYYTLTTPMMRSNLSHTTSSNYFAAFVSKWVNENGTAWWRQTNSPVFTDSLYTNDFAGRLTRIANYFE